MSRIGRYLAGLALAALLLAALTGCSALLGEGQPKEVQIGPLDKGTNVEVTVGDTVRLELEANPSTGYDWHLATALPSQLQTVTDTFDSTGATGTVGSGGVHVFTYRAVSAGMANLSYVYSRSWETTAPPSDTYQVTLAIAQ